MNLMPPVPAGRRYFRLGWILILLWLLNFAFFMGWYFNQQYLKVIEMEENHRAQMQTFQEEREMVDSHQRFMKRFGPEVGYRDAVEALEKNRILWAEGLQWVNDHLPAGVELFHAEADGRRMDGWAVFPSLSEASAFLESLKKDTHVEEVSLDCLGKNCAGGTPPQKMDRGAQILHFHFLLKVQRGFAKQLFAQGADKRSVMLVGSPQEIIEKILYQHEQFGHQRYMAQLEFGGVPFDRIMKNIEIIGTEIVPAIKKYTAKQ